MKNFTSKMLQAMLISALMLGYSSCSNKKTEDSKEVAEAYNDAKFENNKNEKEVQFLVNAAEINREEISLGQLAQQSGKTSDVKELGKMMEKAHTKSLLNLTAMAATKNISIPAAQTEKEQEVYKKLSDKSGINFDKTYAQMMVDGHKDAIKLFETASNESTDLDIKAWATATLPDLRLHLDHSLVCQKILSKMK
ncbi:MAG: DUF4142 domain-containing protein [Bacteroidetes bacterium]|nr:DUF4142 domain-containing protein [Bacteroidota bacterium]